MKKLILLLIIVSFTVYTAAAKEYIHPSLATKQTNKKIKELRTEHIDLLKKMSAIKRSINSNLPPYKLGDIIILKNNFKYQYAGYSKRGLLLTVNNNPKLVSWKNAPFDSLVRLKITNEINKLLISLSNKTDAINNKLTEINPTDIYFDGKWYSLKKYTSLYKKDSLARQQKRVKEVDNKNNKINLLYSSGLLKKFNIDLNQAWVDAFLWHQLDYDVKEGVTKTLAIKCGMAGSTERIDILNNNNGHKLAKYGSWSGFKVY